MKNVRIVHSCLRYPPALGGTETYVKELVERTRHTPERDVRVLTSKLRTHGPLSILPPDELLDDAPYVQRLHHATTPLLSYPRLQALKYYLGHHAPDIVHGYSFWYQPADVAARYARHHKIPFIFHPLYYTNPIREKAVWQLYKRTIGRATFAAADVVVVISLFEQALIEQEGFPVKRFALIPPGIDISRFTRNYENPFQLQGLEGPILLTVGRVAAGKGINEVVQALVHVLKSHPDTQLVCIGEDFGAQGALQKLAENLGIASHVHFWGKVSEDKLVAAYQHADVFVHPSHYEAFGIVLAESLAAKTPVVARNTSAIPHVVPNAKAGLHFATTTELVTHINELLQNTQKREALGQWGHEYVRKNFTWEQSIKKLVKLYDEFGQ